jgi:UDP-glucose 4-epimerase
VVDLAEGHLKALELFEKGKVDGFVVYNLGTGVGYSVLDVVNSFAKASNREIKYEFAERREGDIAIAYADASKAEKIGWKATRGLDEMCRDTWNWQEKNPNGFAK